MEAEPKPGRRAVRPQGASRFQPRVFRAEVEEIARRNAVLQGHWRRAEQGAPGPLEDALREGRPSTALNLVGLALSGGGIRSATFNLGALQALHRGGVLDQVDYLSTVSGGGYIGSCLSANYAAHPGSARSGDFPFAGIHPATEPPALRHLRGASNYLAPRGIADWLQFPVLFARGVLVNAAALLPYVLLAAIGTVLVLGDRIMCPHVSLEPGGCPVFLDSFPWTKGLLAAFVVWLLLYPVMVAIEQVTGRLSWRLREVFGRADGALLAGVVTVAFFEAQPLALYYLKSLLELPPSAVVAALSSLVALTSVLSGKLLKQVSDVLGRAGIYLVGLLGPGVVWVLYLVLCYWATVQVPAWVNAIFALPVFQGGPAVALYGAILSPLLWLGGLLGAGGDWYQRYGSGVLAIYLVLLAIALGYGLLFIDANKTSLHRFYRHRLSRAYLFARDPSAPERPVRHTDRLRLHQLDTTSGPYHLINAALNLSAGDQRAAGGRAAAPFIFSKRFTGCELTGYCETRTLEDVDPHVDVGTCMAISGAAASPVMGTATLRPLVFVMAMLNIRLGYWLVNPAHLQNPRSWYRRRYLDFINRVGPGYFFLEMAGLIGRSSNYVYLSDGGHIENLGVYELLRRRCSVIVACDAEADPEMKFNGLATVIRMARVDLGIHIEIDPAALRAGPQSDSHRHCAVGEIRYPDGEAGMLVYIKASVTGDEDPDILEYRERSRAHGDAGAFPHQTTADQFFDEQQFETYRALGEHIVTRLLAGRDAPLADEDGKPVALATWMAARRPALQPASPAGEA